MRVREVSGRSGLRRFIALPYGLYGRAEPWVPPLRGEVRRQLTVHPFHSYARCRYFLAERGGQIVGRVAAIVNPRYNAFQGVNVGFFGYFECREDADAARALLDAACDALRAAGAASVMGPASPSPNGEFGLLIDGFDLPPGIMMPYHKPYYRGMLEAYGFVKAKDLLAFDVCQETLRPEVFALFERVRRRWPTLTIRPVNVKDFHGEIRIMQRVLNEAWERNWGFVPMTGEEFAFEARGLRRIVDPRVAFIAEIEGAPAGIALSVPDINAALRHARGRLWPLGLFVILYHARRIHRLRTLLLGVLAPYRDRGLDALLYGELIRRGLAAGYTATECSWILEDNRAMIGPMEKLGGRLTKVYRVYERPL